MADIVCSTECAGGVTMNSFPSVCSHTDFGFPKLVILASTSFSAPWTGSPTVAELQAVIATGGSDVIVINNIANGQKLAGEQQVISDTDTPDNLPEVISEREGISGNIKWFNGTVLADLEVLNCHKRLRMWYVTSNGYLFGGEDGYLCSNYFGDWVHDGFGNKAMIPFEFRWMREAITSDPTLDTDYLDLTNAS